MLSESRFKWLAAAVIGLSLAGAGATLRYTADHLGINTDTIDMLSDALPFRQAYERYRREFPALVDRFVVVIDGDTAEQVDAAAAQVAERLRLQPRLFSDIYLAEADEFFVRNAFLYLDEAELETLADRLISLQPFIGGLHRAPDERMLADMIASALDPKNDPHDLPLESLFAELNRTFEAIQAGVPYRLSWQRLLGNQRTDEQALRRFLLLKPVLNFSEPLAAEAAMFAVREAANTVLRGPLARVRVRITGDAALGYEELVSAMQGVQRAGWLALAMVATLLLIGLGSIQLVLAALLTLTVGLIFTAGFATAAIGHLNLISVAFAVLYIGLGVDYAIHLCLRYRELLLRGLPKVAAIRSAVRNISGSLLLCTLTTAIAFYAFLPTAFSGVSELGLISGTGMFINLALSLCLLPACLVLLPAPPARAPQASHGALVRVFEAPLKYARLIRLAALLLGVGALLALPRIEFDRNPLNLRDPNSESIQTIVELMEDGALNAMSITVLAPDAPASARQAQQLEALPEVREVIGVQNLLPDVTRKKRTIIDDLQRILGPSLNSGPNSGLDPSLDFGAARNAPSADESTGAWRRLEAELRRYIATGAGVGAGSAAHLADLIADFLARASGESAAGRNARPDELRERLLANLPAALDRLRSALNPSPGDLVLPEQIRQRWTSAQGLHRQAVYPRENINDNDALRRFVERVQAVVPDATDEPVLNIEAGDAVIAAFVQAFASALILIAALLLIVLRDLRTTLLVLAPLTLAALLTIGTMAVFGLPFNFANVIALPLLFGIGVDNSIHMVLRARQSSEAKQHPMRTSTARAVWFASLTTICSFGNLIFSPHAGTASLGLLLSIGICMTIICTLVLLPALISAPRSNG